MQFSVTFLYLCVLLHLLKSKAEDFHPERTLLIDYYPRHAPQNFLFRGNMPISNGTFAYNSVVSTMKTVASKQNLSLPTNFTLLDISYLNVFEEGDMKIEKTFFESNPNLGKFVNKVIFGTVIPPPENDLKFIKDTVESYMKMSMDDLPNLMEYFHEALTEIQNNPIVIYSHCEAGTDRTGEVSGAYYMKFLNMSFTEALKIDNHVQNRDMYKSSRNAMQWYCFYLHFHEGKTSLECLV